MKIDNRIRYIFFYMLGVSILAAFVYVYTYEGIKDFKKNKLESEEIIRQKDNFINTLTASIQLLESEDRIVDFAIDSLGMRLPLTLPDTFYVNRAEVIRIEKIVLDKYE